MANGTDTVDVKTPDGKVWTIPKANLPKAQTRGAVQVTQGAKSKQAEPSFYEKLTGSPRFDPETMAFDEAHPVLGKATRALSSIGGNILGLPGGLYHAIADKPTPQEEEEFKGHTRIPGELAIERLTSAPIVRGVQDWQKMHPSVRGILSVLPEALGQGVGTVAGAELGGRATKFAGDVAGKAAGKIPSVQPALQEAIVGKAEVENARVEHESKLAELEKEYEEKVQQVGKKTSEDEAAYKTKVEQAKDAYARKLAENEAKKVEASAKETGAETKRKTFQQPRSGPVYQRLSGMADQVAQSVHP